MVPENLTDYQKSRFPCGSDTCTFKEKQPVLRERACNVGAVGRSLCAR